MSTNMVDEYRSLTLAVRLPRGLQAPKIFADDTKADSFNEPSFQRVD